MGPRNDDDQSVRKHLKVFAGGLPGSASEHAVGSHFSRYGHVSSVSVVPPKEGEGKKSPYAFVTFKFAADADCSVVDSQHFPGASRPLAMGFATPRRKDAQEAQSKAGLLSESEPCKVFIAGIGDRDSEEEVGDFFSQWGLVALVYRDRDGWGYVHYGTREGALRLLEEGSVVFQRRRVDVKAASNGPEMKRLDEAEKNDLIRRAIARHFHKKSIGMGPPQAMPPGAPPAGYPAPGYYGGPPAGYYGAPPAGYMPPGYPQPGGYPAPGYPPAGYPPPGYAQPPSSAYYGGAPPPPSGGYPGGPPPPGPGGPGPSPGPGGGPPPSSGPAGEPQRALPAPPPDYYRSGGGAPPPAHGSDPYAAPPSSAPGGYYGRGDPYASAYNAPPGGPPDGQAPPGSQGRSGSQPGAYPGYYRSSEPPRQALPDAPRDSGDDRHRREDYYRSSGGYEPRGEEPRRDSYPPPPTSTHGSVAYTPASDPYYRSAGPPQNAPGYYNHPDSGHAPAAAPPPSQAPPPPGAYVAPPPSGDPYGRAPPDHRHPHDPRYQPY
mmetsp:Transcript_4450/g.11884  ORF Transcript_4450/g.11884 Transcript_4450/m.11884 type:complete len:545 (-) Transcript_4450:237-1871(-)